MKSILNPEAPEFHPHITNTVQDGYTLTSKATKGSNTFPRGPAFSVYTTYTSFGLITSKINSNVVTQSNQIVVTELPSIMLKSHNIDENNTDKVIDVTDCLLDRVYINMDTVSGVNKPSEEFMKDIAKANVSSWNNDPITAKIKLGSATFLGGKNIKRPQLNFKDPVDNSHNLWVPKIFDKPNNIKPLALNIIYNDDGMAVGYEHPYSVELDLYHPPSHFIEPDPELPEYPPPIDQTPLTFVDTEEKLDELVKHLQECEEIAVDVEHHSFRSYQGITCLIQITTYQGGDFIIDTLAIREHIYKLNNSFTDPKKIKILHGAASDVKWLQRDFGVYIVGLFDTFHAGKILQLPIVSLKNLLARYCNVDIDKKYQLADWRIRPLPAELIEYARMDTHYLLYMWKVMKRELLEQNDGLPNLLLSAFENSRQTCCITYNKEVIDDVCHLPLLMRSKRTFNTQQMAALKMLYKWRDAEARQIDEGPSYLIPNHMLLSLAETLPRELQGVTACCSPMPPFIKINLLPIHRMILSCRELPIEPQVQVYQAPPTTAVQSAQNVQHVPSMAGNITGLPPTAVLPPHLNYNAHDLAHFNEPTDEINLEMASVYVDGSYVEKYSHIQFNVQPEVTAFAPDANLGSGVESKLNVGAEMFIPPYDRYRIYRSLAQERELKAIKDKEAKVVALSEGNELIKSEVLLQIQRQRNAAEADAKIISEPTCEDKEDTDLKEDVQNIEIEEKKTKKQRKRKMDKAQLLDKKKQSVDTKVKPYSYKNVNYKKFYSETEKGLKQPKMKLKKP